MLNTLCPHFTYYLNTGATAQVKKVQHEVERKRELVSHTYKFFCFFDHCETWLGKNIKREVRIVI